MELQQALEKDLGLAIQTMTQLLGGTVNETYLLSTDRGEVVVKIAKKRNAFPVESWVYQRGVSLDIPFPNVLAFKEKGQHVGYPLLLLSKVKGTPLNKTSLTEEQEEILYQEVGEIMSRLHIKKVPGFGFTSIRDGELVGADESWSAFWGQLWDYDEMNDLNTEGLVTPEEYEKVKENFEELKRSELSSAVLVYNDLHGSHIFTDGEKITGVIDAGNCIAGDPRYDIAMSHFFQNPDQQEAFNSGYGELTQDPIIQKYLIHIAASKLSMRFIRGDKASVERARKKLQEFLDK